MASLNETVGQHYDDNERFAQTLKTVAERLTGQKFEYPDWDYKSIGDLIKQFPIGYAMTIGRSLGPDMADKVRERLFVVWVNDNYRELEGQEILDHHVYSGEYLEDFLNEIHGAESFNDTSNGIFGYGYLDGNGIPVSDTFAAELRSALHGTQGSYWTVEQNAELIASMSSEEMSNVMRRTNAPAFA